jgi:serine/threonine protein phosphatase PrpC
MSGDVLLLAGDLSEKTQVVLEAPPTPEGCLPAALAMTPGAGPSKNPKRWVCEDSAGLLPLGEGAWLSAVADSHWGGAASQDLVRALRPAWESSPTPPAEGIPDLAARLLWVLRAADDHLARSKGPDDPSETTLLLAHVAGRRVTWISVGDSYLLRVRSTGCEVLNTSQGVFPIPFLGTFPISALPPAAPGPDQGALDLEPGDVLLLATDGIEFETSALGLTDLPGLLLGEAPLGERVARLLQMCADPSRGGGGDNLALVACQA